MVCVGEEERWVGFEGVEVILWSYLYLEIVERVAWVCGNLLEFGGKPSG
jgi:hypothetical protein